jgi:hypothetical protein
VAPKRLPKLRRLMLRTPCIPFTESLKGNQMAFDKDAFLTALDSMTVMELNDLVKAIEEKFGVSAACHGRSAAGGAAAAAAAAEEKTEFNVVLPKPAPTRCPSSRPCAKSPAWA